MENNKQSLDINDEQKKELLKVLLKKALEDKEKENADIPSKIELLKELSKSYQKENDFKVGDIIKWKEQLKNRKLPDYNEPVIILEIIEEPFINEKEQFGSMYFNEKLDIKVGIYRDNSLLTFHFDKQRFEQFE